MLESLFKTKKFVAYPNDKVSINDVTLKIPYHSVVEITLPVNEVLQLTITKIDKLDKIEL